MADGSNVTGVRDSSVAGVAAGTEDITAGPATTPGGREIGAEEPTTTGAPTVSTGTSTDL